ncbi:hypothetical protein FIBSPDRAFT_416298 [Athelia psychrophila]|uniref:Uncharacterized protein n=1 Tax=Athelia psychrophila TaxID=1759441 RepID=A0A166N272_9AGAM|nr:hypothetical protein FIBSPDRAFT_416298 [Fibularhizoctonia sp. CBS 109695]
MATPATRTAPAPSAGTPGPGPASSRPRDLSGLRNGDAGSAFRGTKGRDGNPDRGGGRGGNRNGRGGRGTNGPSRTRAGTEPNTPKADPSPLKVEVPVETKPAAGTVASSSPSAEKPAAGAKNPNPKPKVPSRRGSRNVPAVAVAPPSPTVEATPPSATRPKNPPRQRPTQSKVAANPVRQSLSIDAAMSQSSLRPQKARTGPPTPTIVKDVPPHLSSASAAPEVTTFDMKHDIDALVEHMRSAAMSDSLRPTTPGSHIDWAGDDDDSLPDLNDWGVTTSYSKAAVEMSPILVDNLKPLPEAVTRIKTEAAADSIAATPTEQNPSLQPTSVPAPPAVSPQSAKVTLHPSLPAKPALPKFAEKPKAKVVQVPARVTVTLAQSAAQADKPAAQVEPPAATAEKFPQVPVVKLPTSTASENTVTISDAEAAEDTEFAVEKSTKNTGLSASMHAPSPLSESSSSPTLSTANPPSTAPPTGPRSFTPTHQRAHTVGRSHPLSPPANQRFPRAGAPPRGGFHNRTHSSPPAGPDSTPRVHTRPVLTNDALSRLMKTVVNGNNPIKAREVIAATE